MQSNTLVAQAWLSLCKIAHCFPKRLGGGRPNSLPLNSSPMNLVLAKAIVTRLQTVYQFFTESLKKRFSDDGLHAYGAVEFRRSRIFGEHCSVARFYETSIRVYGNLEIAMRS